MRKPLIVGNWKMNKTASEAADFIRELLTRLPAVAPNADVVLAPPFTSLETARKALGPSSWISLGAQNVHWETQGAFTGEISAPMLRESLAEREAGQTESVVTTQLTGSLAGFTAQDLATVTIAYEPVWAIGTGRAATTEQAVAVHRSIRTLVATSWGDAIASAIRILYGGSVTPQNIAALLASDTIDGALVGGACLNPDSFATIVGIAQTQRA